MPAGTPVQLIRHQKRPVHYVVGGLIETQIALVNLGCIPVHVWGSRASHPHRPDWVVFDLDPGSGEFGDAAKAAAEVLSFAEKLGKRLAAADPDILTVEQRYSVRRREKAPFSMPLRWPDMKPSFCSATSDEGVGPELAKTCSPGEHHSGTNWARRN